MWISQTEQVDNGRVIRVACDPRSSSVSFAEVLLRWQTDAGFRSLIIGQLAASPYSAFRWEVPPLTAATVNRPFEYVIVDSPGLARNPDAEAFAQHFSDMEEECVVDFPNLGGDAIMVVPCPRGPLSAYGHLGAFIREAPERQKHALWQLVGKAMERRLSSKPVWLSTAGAGVSWLHVRLDDHPKYYSYEPYRRGP